MSAWSQCGFCKHYVGGIPRRCAAFPSGIPDEIFGDELDHSQNVKGDNGVRFEPDEGWQKILDRAKRLGVEVD